MHWVRWEKISIVQSLFCCFLCCLWRLVIALVYVAFVAYHGCIHTSYEASDGMGSGGGGHAQDLSLLRCWVMLAANWKWNKLGM